jgi:ferredoxin
MPWINPDQCTGCAICIQNCPADAILMENDIARIDQKVCIRCGVCHDRCPNDAVRHDRESIPRDVRENLMWVEALRKHPYYAGNPERQAGLNGRLIKHFNRLIEISRQTLESMQNDPVNR